MIYDVIIVGYGPVGAILANLLGCRGLSVMVVERMADIFDKPRAINIDHEVMRILQSVGLADRVDAICSPHTGTEFRGLNNRLIKLFTKPEPPFPLGWTPNLMFIQPEFEPILRSGVTRFENVEVRLQHDAVAFAQDDEQVTLSVKSLTTGESTNCHGRYLVACDGAASPLRKMIGSGQESLEFDECWTVVDAWVADDAGVPATTTQFCLPSSPTTYVVGPRNLRRWELKILPSEDPASYSDFDVIKRRLAHFVDTERIEIWRAATYRFHALLADQWRVGRVFLAGDAAHQMPPFLAQGLCSGIRDAGNLGWKLNAVLRRGAPDALLDTYAAERKPHMRVLVETTKGLGELIGELDPEAAARRDERLGAAFDQGQTVTLRQQLIPDLTAGLIAKQANGQPMLGAGALFVQPREAAGTQGRRLDDVIGPDFAIVFAGEDATEWLDDESEAAWKRLSGRKIWLVPSRESGMPAGTIVFEEAAEGLLRNWVAPFGANCAIVVRPDKFVYGVAASAAQLCSYVQAIAGAVAPK